MDFNTTHPTNTSNVKIILPCHIYTPISPTSSPPTTTGRKTPVSPTSAPPGRKNKPAPNPESEEEEEELPYHIQWADELARRRRRHIAAERLAAAQRLAAPQDE